MCQSYRPESNENESRTEKRNQITELKFKLNKRVQLLKHFFKSFEDNKKGNSSTKQKEILIMKIIKHLDRKKKVFIQNIASNVLIGEKFYAQIQNFLMYSIYLEENSIINHIKNPHRLFSNLYYQIDIPTKVLHAYFLLVSFHH